MSRSARAFDHVVFDLDGTLLDTRADIAGAMNHVLLSFGLAAVSPETLYAYVGEGVRFFVEQALGPDCGDRLEEGVRRYLAYYGKHLLDGTRPYTGMAEVVEQLAARGVALSVLTNKPEAMSRRLLDGLGLLPRFVAVIGGDSLPTRKPDPAGVDHLRALTATARNRMLLVGDSRVDVRTARAARIAFCGVAWGLTPDAMWAAEPGRVVDDPAELVALVDGRRGS